MKTHPAIRIRYKVILISSLLLVLAFAITLVSAYMYTFNSKFIIDRTIFYQQKVLDYVGDSVSDYLDDVDSIAASISENHEILDLLSEDFTDTFQPVLNSRKISSMLSSFVYSNDKIRSINLISNRFPGINDSAVNGVISSEYISSEFADTTYKVADQGWFLMKDGYVAQDALNSLGSNEPVVSCFKNLYYKNTHKWLGMLVISFNESVLYEMIQNSVFDTDTQALIIHENRVILSHSDKSKIGTTLHSTADEPILMDYENNLLTISHKLPQHKWTIIQELDVRHLTREVDNVAKYILILGAVVLSITAVLSVILSNAITQPLKQLSGKVRNLSKNKLEPNQDHYLVQEVDSLNQHFNSMTVDIKNLLQEVQRKQKQQHDTELKLLQAQINPHFIYNTIELINYVAAKEHQFLICEIVHSFGRFLRLSLNNGRDYLTISQELEQITNYLKLQALKYEDSFSVQWDISPEILDGYTLKMLLQPLVENCIVHGFSKTRGAGTIRISGMMEGQDTVILVEDDGTGMDTASMKKILTEATPGYGVYNVHERIHNKFGGSYGLSYARLSTGGTRVTVRIPYVNDISSLQEQTPEN